MSDIHFHFMYGLNGLYIPNVNDVHFDIEEAIENAAHYIEDYLDSIADQDVSEQVNVTQDWTYAEEAAYLEAQLKELKEYDTTEIAKRGWACNTRGDYDLMQITQCTESECMDYRDE